MHFSYRQKAYLLIFVGIIGLFLPFVPGVILVLLGASLLADKKGRVDVDIKKLFKGKESPEGSDEK